MPFTVLISSVSKKVPLVKCVRMALEKIDRNGKIIGADVDGGCIGRYFVDEFWEMPHLSRLTPKEFITYCKSKQVNVVIPTRDGELGFFSENKDVCTSEGIHIMVSNSDAIQICTDKYLFFQTLDSKGFPTIPSSLSLDDLQGNGFVVKERYGAGSRSMGLNIGRSEALKHAQTLKAPIFQPYIKGREISVDLFIDKTGKTKGLILRERNLVVDGESQITRSFQDETLEQFCAALAESLDLEGHVMFQIIQDEKNGKFYVLECNPRFGGASPLSVAMGLDSFFWFFMESKGKNLSQYPFQRSTVEKKMVRYSEDLFLP